jgi:hypothetical protein
VGCWAAPRVRVDRRIMDTEHPSLREDWDLQPNQPAAH